MRIPILLFVCVLAAALWEPDPARAGGGSGVVLVCHAKTGAKVSRGDLKGLYLGKVKTRGGAPVIVVVRPEGDEVFEHFATEMFDVSAKTLLAKIKQEVFKGEMTKPIKAADDAAVLHAVAADPAAIGVVATGAARTLPDGVAVLEVTP